MENTTPPNTESYNVTFATVDRLDPSIDPATVHSHLICWKCQQPIPHGASFAILSNAQVPTPEPGNVWLQCLDCADEEGA